MMVTKIYTPFKERIVLIIASIFWGFVAFFIGTFLTNIASSRPGPFSWVVGLPGAILGLIGLFLIIIQPVALLLGYDFLDNTYYAPPGSPSPSDSQDDSNLEEIAEGELRNRGM